MSNNMEFDKNSQGPNKGVSGYLENSLAKNRVNRFAFGSGDNQESGFLNEAVKNADALIQKIKEIEKELGGANKVTQSMTKTQEKAYERSKSDAKLLSDTMKEIQRTGSLSQAELNQLIKDNEKVSKDAVKILTNLINSMDKSSSSNIKRQKELIEQTNLVIQKQNEQISKSKQDMKELNQELKDTQDTFTKGLGNTLKNTGNQLAGLANMFNLQSIANNAAEQNARSKVAIMNEINKQFGFTSNGQFESFKNSLNDSLKQMNSEMGSIFNADDLKNYMSNLSQYGIISTEMAKEQMRASIIGNKYLGVSVDTQEMIFKYMKRTNNNDAINEHNRMVVGILNSQLGISKEQLDILSQQTYSDMDALAALGADEATTSRYRDEANAAKATMESYNEAWGQSLGNIFNEMIAMPYTDMMKKYSNIFGGSGNAKNIYDQLTSGNVTGATQSILSNEFLRSLLSGKDKANASFVMEALGVKDNANFVNMMRTFSDSDKQTEFLEKMNSTLENIKNTTDANVDEYIQEKTEVTLLESIQNKLSILTNGINWKYTMGLANIAFGVIALGQTVDLISKGSSFFKALGSKGAKDIIDGQLSMKEFNTGNGTAGKVLSGLAAGTIAVGLTYQALSMIGNYLDSSRENAMNQNAENFMNESKGDSGLSRGFAEANYSGFQSDSENISKGERAKNYFSIGSFMKNFGGSAVNAFDSTFGNLFRSNNPFEYNKGLWKIFARERENLYSEDEWLAIQAAYAWALFEQGQGNVVSSLWSGYDKESLKTYLKNYGTLKNMQEAVNILAKNDLIPIDKSKNKWDKTLHNDTIGINYSDSEGYHKAGLNWVPRDNYQALLHKGEMVLNAKDAAVYRNIYGIGGESDGSTSSTPSPLYNNYPWPMTAGWPRYPQSKKQHRGIDWGIPVNTPVGAAYGGRVVALEKNNFGKSGYGNFVRVLGDNGKYYRYGHLTKPLVEIGQTVEAGTTIGLSGNTGNSTGPHLHFQVDSGESYTSDVNPYPYITNGLFQTNGNIPSNNITSEASNMSAVNTLGARRYIPKSLSTGGIGGPEGVSQITSSVDGGFDRLISYLDSISREQNEQRALLETYSIAKGSESNY